MTKEAKIKINEGMVKRMKHTAFDIFELCATNSTESPYLIIDQIMVKILSEVYNHLHKNDERLRSLKDDR